MADKSTIARPYAKAAFEEARDHKRLGPWSDALRTAAGLREFVDAKRGGIDEGIERALQSPADLGAIALADRYARDFELRPVVARKNAGDEKGDRMLAKIGRDIADPKLAVAAQLADTEPIAAALPEGSQNRQAVSSALRAMVADGTIDDLAERWLGESLSDSESNVPLLRTNES